MGSNSSIPRSRRVEGEVPHPSLPMSYNAAIAYGLVERALPFTNMASKRAKAARSDLERYVRELVGSYSTAVRLSKDRATSLRLCTLSLAQSAIEKVCKNLYNPDYLKCIAVAAFIMVEEKMSGNDIMEKLKDECDSTRIERIVADMKKRQFEETGCRIAS